MLQSGIEKEPRMFEQFSENGIQHDTTSSSTQRIVAWLQWLLTQLLTLPISRVAQLFPLHAGHLSTSESDLYASHRYIGISLKLSSASSMKIMKLSHLYLRH